MKKQMILFAFLLMAMSAFSQSRTTYQCTGNNVNVRKGPGTNYGLVEPGIQLFKGQTVESDGRQSNGFLHVYSTGRGRQLWADGWVSAQYLTQGSGGSVSNSNGRVIEITSNNYNKILNSNKYVILDFYTTWCGWCHKLAPIMEDLAKEYNGRVVMGRIDAEQQSRLAAKYDVSHYPTIVFLNNGRVVATIVGYREKSVLRQQINYLF